MICNKCGYQNNQDAVYCAQCNSTLENSQNYNVNTQTTSSGYCKLTLTRPKNFVGCLVKFKIFIDNEKVGTIKNGETVVLNISSGNHIISFNKTMEQNIYITQDTTANVGVIAAGRFGIINIDNVFQNNINNNQINNMNNNTINNNINTINIDKIKQSAKGPLIFSCACIGITFILLITMGLVISPIMYGISIGYSIINLSSLKNYKETLKDEYKSLVKTDIISIVISIIGFLLSGFLIIG